MSGGPTGSQAPIGVVGVGRMGEAVCARLADCGIPVYGFDVADRRAAAAADAGRGLGFLDAPVGGNPDTARRGELLAFAGGSAHDLRAVRAVLDRLADEVLPMGATGAGCTAKLLVNLMWLEQAIAGAEVLTLGGRLGLDDATLLDAVHRSAAANRFMDDDALRLLRGENMTSFSLARCRDELREVLELAGPVDVAMPLAQRTLELYDAAVERYGDIDGELLGARMIMDRNRPPGDGG